MEKTFKRLLSLAIALVMILGMIPVTQLEAEATTVTDIPMEPTVTAPETPVVVVPEDKKAPEHVNDKLPFEGAEGGKAMCYACGQEVDWTALTADYSPADVATPAGHYYVPDGTEELHITAKNKNSFFLWVASGTVCLHLNGNKLKINGLLYASTGVFNLMGEGTLTGTYYWKDEPFRCAVHFNPSGSDTGRVNLYGGNIVAGNASAKSAVSVATASPKVSNPTMNIYDDVVIDRFYQNSAKVNMYGGTIQDKAELTNAWVAGSGNSVMDYSVSQFNMFDGAQINGRVMVGKDSTANSTNEVIAKNNETVNFNMYGGTVNGLGTLEEALNDSGAAFHLSGGAQLNIHGGVINGGYPGANHYGGAIYAASPSVKNEDGSVRVTKVVMTGGVINGQSGTYENALNAKGNPDRAKLSTYTVAASGGGCLHLYDGADGDTRFDMFGGTINGAFARGGSIYTDGATVNLCGNALVQNGYAALSAGNIRTLNAAVVNIFDEATVQNGKVYCVANETTTDNKAKGGNFHVTTGGVVNVCGGHILNGESFAHSDGGGNFALDSGATLNFYAGEIKGGIAHSNAAGNVFMQGGSTLNMYGGTMTGGAHPTVKVDACYGGNVYMTTGSASSSAVLNMYGGVMQNGITLVPGTKDTWGVGGNIYGGAYAKVNILGGTVQNGTAQNKYEYNETKKNTGSFGGGNIYMISTGSTLTVGKNPETGAKGQILGGQAISGGSIAARDGAKIILNDGALISGGTSTGTYATYKTNMRTNYGGGNIYVYNSTLEINSGAEVTGGFATAFGGNIMAEGTSAAVTVAGGTIHHGETNYGTLREGKTYHAYAGGNIVIGSGAELTMTSGTVKNATVNTTGGNILVLGDKSALNVTGGTVSYGKSLTSSGGNIQVGIDETTTTQTANIANATIQNGYTKYAGGNIRSYAPITLTKCTVSNGYSGSQSGGIYTDKTCKLTIDGCTFSDNTCSSNGGNLHSIAETVTIRNSTFTGGSATNGGSIYLGSNVTEVLISGCTISGGEATASGGNVAAHAVATRIEGSEIFGGVANGASNAYTGGGNIYLSSKHSLEVVETEIYAGVTKGSGGNILSTSDTNLYLKNGAQVYDGESQNTAKPAGGGNIQTSTGNIYVQSGAAVYGGTAAQTETQSHEIGAVYGGNIYLQGGTIGSAENKDRNAIYIMRHIDSTGADRHAYLSLTDGTLYGNYIGANNKNDAAPVVTVQHGKFSVAAVANLSDDTTTTVTLKNDLYEVHTAGDMTVTVVDPTCTEGGYTLTTCAFVDEEKGLACTGEKTAPTAAHTKTFKAEEPASCAATGMKAYYACSCGKNYEDEACENEIADLSAWIIEKEAHAATKVDGQEASHTAAGYKAAWFCDVCDTYFADETCETVIGDEAAWTTWKTEGEGKVPQVEHTFDQKNTDEKYLKSAATCKEEAVYYFSCACGAKGTETFESGDVLGHSFTNYVSDGNATCTANGTETATCDNGCGETNTRTAENSMLAHDLKEIPEVPAQVGVAGTEAYYQCKTCEKKFSDAEGKTEIEAPVEIPALPEEEGTFKVGDKTYETFADVLNDYEAGKEVTVKLIGAATVEALTVQPGMTLDLNGKALTVNGEGVVFVYNDAAIVDSSADHSGRLNVKMSQLYMNHKNSYLPVDTGNGLMFVMVTSGHGMGSENGYQCWINNMDAQLAELLKTKKASELGLKFQVVITWGSNELTYTFSDDTVSKYAADWQKLAMYLKVTGAEQYSDLKYQARIAAAVVGEAAAWSAGTINHN